MAANTVAWIDIPVTDLDRAITFYSAVLGAKVSKQGGGGCFFGLLPHTEHNVSGCLVVMPDNQPSRSGPLVYLAANGRLDAALAAVSAHGGTVLQPKHPIGEHGFRAVIVDSEGNRIALHSPTA